MTTPARRHYQRVIASQASSTAEQDSRTRENASEYELMLTQLAEDRRTLKTIQSQEHKAKRKADMVTQYADWIAGVIEGDTGAQDIILTTVMVWLIDAGDIKAALPLAEYALKHNLKLPDQYERQLPVVLAEESADYALKQRDAGIDVESLLTIADLTEASDMPDQVRAKLHKAIGLGLLDATSKSNLEINDKKAGFTNALEHLQRALQLNTQAGVKKEIEKLQITLKNMAQAPA